MVRWDGERPTRRNSLSVGGRQRIVLLPGMDGDIALRDDLVRRLAAHHDLHAVELPGAALDRAETQHYIAGRLPATPCVIVAESYAGPLAIEIAARHGDRIAALVLAATFARNPLPRFLRHATGLLDPRRMPWSISEAILFGDTGTPELRQRLRDVVHAIPPAVLAHRASHALATDVRDHLAALRCPVLCIHGTRDRLIRPAFAREIAALAVDCRMRWITAGHMVLETHAHEAATAILDFCATLASPAAPV